MAIHRRWLCRLGLLAVTVIALTTHLRGEERGTPAPALAVMPSTIQVDPRLESVIAQMLLKSPTFQRQCRLIGDAPGAVVSVRVVPAMRGTSVHASAWLRRYSSGLVIAYVEVPAASSLVELIAHELEHVVEFVEGVDLNALAAARPAGAFRAKDGSFETWRAIAAGRAAYAEFHAH